MNLTPAQLTALATDIANDATLNAITKNADGFVAIAAAYNLVVTSPGTFWVYRSNVPVQEIFDQIVWANFTPVDAADGTTLWQNRSMAAQGKSLNLQTLLMGQTQVNANKTNVRAGLQDGLTNLPTGTSGGTVAAGWTGVRDNVLARAATRAEKLFAGTNNPSGHDGSTAALAVILAASAVAGVYAEGAVTAQNVEQALGL